jgi:hypothetical protein
MKIIEGFVVFFPARNWAGTDYRRAGRISPALRAMAVEENLSTYGGVF